MEKSIILLKKRRGDNGRQYISVYIREEMVSAIDLIAYQTDRSRNEVINILLDFGLSNHVVEEK